MHTKTPRAPIFEKPSQGFFNRVKSNLGPWDFFFREQSGFQRFRSPTDSFGCHLGQVEKMDLANMWHAHNRKNLSKFEINIGFFVCFTACAVEELLPVSQEAGLQSTNTASRFDCALAKQDFLPEYR